MAEVLVAFTDPVGGEDGKIYTARACGSEMADGKWQGWIEFIPRDGGEPVRSSRETTQPNRDNTMYWATGLTAIYLEGSLRRTLNPLVRPIAREIAPPAFDEPAPPAINGDAPVDAVLNPFSAYRKGEALLRRQLAALSGWHLVNIIRSYDLSDRDPALLGATEPSALIEIIVKGVREANRGVAP